MNAILYILEQEQELVRDLRRRIEAVVDSKDRGQGSGLNLDEIAGDPSFLRLREDWLREVEASLSMGGPNGGPIYVDSLVT